MHINHDSGVCVGHGQCTDAAPEVFHLDEEGTLKLLDEWPAESLRQKVMEAARRCPSEAIRVED
ncbi:MAG: ferredoxin [Acidimicrobiaceae bacterium]|nr:ferredoxin [Acidimicrobiaceae bacterium]